jgi:flagella basal body P-ring formation protein FlgA
MRSSSNNSSWTTVHRNARAIAALVAVVAGLMLSSVARAQDSVRLKPRVALAELSRVTLGDIATIEGSQAAMLSSIVIAEKATGESLRVEIETVRSAIASTAGINAGRVAISGTPVEVSRAVKQEAKNTAEIKQISATSTINATRRVRDELPAFVANLQGVSIDRVKLELDEGDAALLDIALDNRTFTIAPMGKGDKPSLHVRVYEGDTLVAARTTRVGVLLLREVVVAKSNLTRGMPLDALTTTREERWLPAGTRAALADDAIGKVAKSTISAGDTIETRQLDDAIVIHRGDLVAVDCVAGSVVVRSQMRAKADAKVGEMVELVAITPTKQVRERGEKRVAQQSIRARVAGPGRAVVVTSSEPQIAAAAESEPDDASRSEAQDKGMDAHISKTGTHRTIVLPLHRSSRDEEKRP